MSKNETTRDFSDDLDKENSKVLTSTSFSCLLDILIEDEYYKFSNITLKEFMFLLSLNSVDHANSDLFNCLILTFIVKINIQQ